MGNVIQLALTDLIPGEFHPHQENQNDNLTGLVNSIKNLGIIEPLIVRKKDNKYEIIIGNRRYNAAKQLNLEKVPAIVINATDEDVLNMVITNNVQRKELTGKEEAILYEKAIKHPNINVEQLSLKLGISEERINSKLKIIRKAENRSNQIINNPILNEQKEENQNNKNNLINNDIISLNNLNNEEIRRERSNMNENQFMPSNNQQSPQNIEQNQGPTFGGRFFPSMEEQPQNIPQQEIAASPAIEINTNIPMPPTPEPIPTPMPAQSQQVNTPIENNIGPEPNLNIPTYNNVEAPNVSIPESTPTPTLEEIEQSLNITPEPTPSVPEISNINMPMEANEIINAQQNNNSIPQTPSIDINNMPNLNINPSSQQKDVTPIINMIKSIATNMELLGYKINVTENDGPTNYSINIEVEK